MLNILRLLVILSIVLFACGSESVSSQDSDLKNNSKIVDFEVILEDLMLDNFTINNIQISSISCDPLQSGNICNELSEIISNEGLFFNLGGNQLPKEAELIIEQEGKLSLNGVASFGESGNVIPAECIYSVDESVKTIIGNLIFNYNNVQVRMHFKENI